jgi:hypothetical protein
VGIRFKNRPSLLYFSDTRLFNLQRWGGAHELDYGEQTGTHSNNQRFTKLD